MTTNNHPAHGPVSIDRLHQISEILSTAAAQSDGGNLGYAMADAVKVIAGAIASFGAEPVISRDELLELIEGMEVSVDVSTCDADAGHRYFCTVTEISELETAKNVFILLVQDAKPNFKQAGNSPVTPDGWIPVSERMPEKADEVLCAKEFYGLGDWRQKVGYYLAGKWMVYGASWTPTHWMTLPAVPHFREIGDSSTNNCRENAKTSTNQVSLNCNVTIDCWCRTCRPVTMNDMRFVVCPECGNKRCPRANDHRNDCTGSNEPGQIGSAYQASPQQEVTSARVYPVLSDETTL